MKKTDATKCAQLQVRCKQMLSKLDAWAKQQKNVRLVLGAPMSDSEIDQIPFMIKRTDMPDVYSPDQFLIPNSYRAFLRVCRSAEIEVQEPEGNGIYAMFNIYSPLEVAEVRAWLPAGVTLDDEREVSTTEFIAFADGGLSGEANYWCLFTGVEKGIELPVYFLDNDTEFLIGRYAGTTKWIAPEYKKPEFASFDIWLEKLIDWICAEPFALGRVRNSW